MVAPVLDRYLTLEAPLAVPDSAGGFDMTWSVLGQLWAELRPGSGNERAGQMLTASRSRYRITVRAARPGAPSRPRPEQRFRDGARTFVILAVNDRDDRGRYLTCIAEEEVVT